LGLVPSLKGRYVTNRKVSGSIHHEVNGFYNLPDSASLIMALKPTWTTPCCAFNCLAALTSPELSSQGPAIWHGCQ
jgi:hypothetical protein